MRPTMFALILIACGSSRPTPADVADAAAKVQDAARVLEATCKALPRPLSPEAERVCGADPESAAGGAGGASAEAGAGGQ